MRKLQPSDLLVVTAFGPTPLMIGRVQVKWRFYPWGSVAVTHCTFDIPSRSCPFSSGRCCLVSRLSLHSQQTSAFNFPTQSPFSISNKKGKILIHIIPLSLAIYTYVCVCVWYTYNIHNILCVQRLSRSKIYTYARTALLDICGAVENQLICTILDFRGDKMWRVARSAASSLRRSQRRMSTAIPGPCIVHKRGADILHDPWFNKVRLICSFCFIVCIFFCCSACRLLTWFDPIGVVCKRSNLACLEAVSDIFVIWDLFWFFSSSWICIGLCFVFWVFVSWVSLWNLKRLQFHFIWFIVNCDDCKHYVRIISHRNWTASLGHLEWRNKQLLLIYCCFWLVSSG